VDIYSMEIGVLFSTQAKQQLHLLDVQYILDQIPYRLEQKSYHIPYKWYKYK
jgi:hypothetical protein